MVFALDRRKRTPNIIVLASVIIKKNTKVRTEYNEENTDYNKGSTEYNEDSTAY